MDLRGSGFIILRNKAKKLFSFSSTGRDLGRTKPKRSSSCNLFFSTLIGFRADVAQRVSVSLAESQSQGHGIAELMSSAAGARRDAGFGVSTPAATAARARRALPFSM